MFPEHSNTIWGTHCGECGNECSVLQNTHHPWDRTSFTIKLECPACGHEVTIDQRAAEDFYNQKIYSYFTGLSGHVIDLGCGSGFLSRFLLQEDCVERIYGLDKDSDCLQATQDLAETTKKFTFIQSDLSEISLLFPKRSIDFFVSRDVFMFIEDTDRFFDDVSALVDKGVLQMGWYMKENQRMKNKVEPQKIAENYKKKRVAGQS